MRYSCCGSHHMLIKSGFENLCHQIMNSVASRVNWPLRILRILCTAIMDIEIKRKIRSAWKRKAKLALINSLSIALIRLSVKNLNKIMFNAEHLMWINSKCRCTSALYEVKTHKTFRFQHDKLAYFHIKFYYSNLNGKSMRY